MRVTTATAYSTTIDTLQQRQQALQNSQDRLTSGKRVARASDDPAAAARAERALAVAARSDADRRALEAARNAMQQAENALGGAVDLMQQVRELVVAAGNGSYGDAERANLGARIRGLRDQLLGIANRGDGAGGYLFGGQGSAQPPFVDGAGGVAWRGTGGVAAVVAGDRLPLTLDGAATWLGARSGNGVFVTAPDPANGPGAWIDAGRVADPSQLTGADYRIVFSVAGATTTYGVLRNGAPLQSGQPYTAGQAIEFDGMAVTVNGTPADGDAFDLTPAAPDLSLFDALDRLSAELRTGGRSPAQVAQTVQTGLRDVDAALAQLQLQRASAGESLNHFDTVEGRLVDAGLHARTERSIAEDLDMVEAVSEFQRQQSGYEAALKAYSLVQRLSLFQTL